MASSLVGLGVNASGSSATSIFSAVICGVGLGSLANLGLTYVYGRRPEPRHEPDGERPGA